MATPIHGESTPEELNIFFIELQTRADEAGLPMIIIPNEVCFRNAANRRAHYGENPDDVRQYQLATQVAYMGRQSGTLMMVANCPNLVWEQTRLFRSGTWTEEERTAYRQGEAEWHCFAMSSHDTKVSNILCPSPGSVGPNQCYIYDSSYLPGNEIGRQRLGHLPNLHMARNVIQAWRARPLRLTEIWVGGGGNYDNTCRRMTAQWMQDVVSRLLLQCGQAVDTDGWEQVFI
ncbi:MAG: Phospholipase C [Watsoniomyces obsoletus]|nr:MAG: Phospholipase C [Watsoniomyces obsoletus]